MVYENMFESPLFFTVTLATSVPVGEFSSIDAVNDDKIGLLSATLLRFTVTFFFVVKIPSVT